MTNTYSKTSINSVASIGQLVASADGADKAVEDAVAAAIKAHKASARKMFTVFSRDAWKGATKDDIAAATKEAWSASFEAECRARRGDKWFNTKQRKTTKGRHLMSTQWGYFLRCATAIANGLIADAKGEADSIRGVYKLLMANKINVPGYKAFEADTPAGDAQANNASTRDSDAGMEQAKGEARDAEAHWLAALGELVPDMPAEDMALALDNAEDVARLLKAYVAAKRKGEKVSFKVAA